MDDEVSTEPTQAVGLTVLSSLRVMVIASVAGEWNQKEDKEVCDR